jgi:hypothetical protein
MGDSDSNTYKLKLTPFNGEQAKWAMWKRLRRAKLFANGYEAIISRIDEPDTQTNSKAYLLLLEACYSGKASPIVNIVPEGDGPISWHMSHITPLSL